MGCSLERKNPRADCARRPPDPRWFRHRADRRIERRYAMTPPPQPPKGNMVLWDHIFPPLLDGSYRWHTETDVTYQIAAQVQGQPPQNDTQDLPEAVGYF